MKRLRKIVIGLGIVLMIGLLGGLGVVSSTLLLPTSPGPILTAALGAEIMEARGRSSKTYDLGDNKYALDASLGAVHYRDEFRVWQEIDNQWSAAQPPWDWEMLEDGYHTKVLEDFTAGQILLFEARGESVAFQPMALEWTNALDQIDQISMPQDVTVSVSNEPVELLPGMTGSTSKIRWDDGYGTGRHFEWENTPGRLSKLLILDSSPPAPPQYIIDGGNPVLRLSFIFDPSAELDIYVDGLLWDKSSTDQTFNTIEFKLDDEFPEHDWGDEVLWGFMPAAYWDSDESEGVALTELRKVGNKLYVCVRVSHEWLQTATYPVYIDPTLDLQVGANLGDVHENEASGVVTDSATEIRHYARNLATARFWAGHRFVSVSLPSEGDTIDIAYAQIYIYDTTYDDIDGFWHFEELAAPAQFTTNNNDVTARDRTEASVADDNDSMGVGWHQTDSLVTPLQEVIDSYSPTAIVLIFRPNALVGITYASSRAYNDTPAEAAKLHIEYTAASNTILLQVAADLDDVHEREDTGTTYDDGSAVYHNAAFLASGRYWGGHRWASGSLPSIGDTIDKCYIQLFSTTDSFDDMDGNWQFEELAAPAQFTAGVGNTDVTERDRTETSVSWQEDSLGDDVWVQSPELKTALQEVIDSYSPTALVAIFRPNQVDSKSVYTRAHNSQPTLAGRIFIKWTPAAAAGYSYGTIIG